MEVGDELNEHARHVGDAELSREKTDRKSEFGNLILLLLHPGHFQWVPMTMLVIKNIVTKNYLI